jgi:hypothetical protein
MIYLMILLTYYKYYYFLISLFRKGERQNRTDGVVYISFYYSPWLKYL